jgi:DNA modification methylase
MLNIILQGDCYIQLRTLQDESVQCCVTSPPYYKIQDYGVPPSMWGGQEGCQHEWRRTSSKAVMCSHCGAEQVIIGQEATPELYVEHMVMIMRELRRILKATGTLWMNCGDTYQKRQLLGIPWRLALALQNDGWYLRSDIIWHKPTAMPESVKDRPSKAHEYLFLLTKSSHYYYDADSIREPLKPKTFTTFGCKHHHKEGEPNSTVKADNWRRSVEMRQPRLTENGQIAGANKRTVWSIAKRPFKDAHDSVMPNQLVTPCILAGSRPGDLVLDPFSGAGTVAVVAAEQQRAFIGIEIKQEYIEITARRLRQLTTPSLEDQVSLNSSITA